MRAKLAGSSWRGKFRALTMSSGSSGNNVMVPEPSRSTFCLIRRMVCRYIGEAFSRKGEEKKWWRASCLDTVWSLCQMM